ncbi:hypothetical protein [Aeromonas phage AS-szw]|uniref:Uncharacterized protein n=1 Tax=Aeromonas phage AS-szw TaxID=2026114 RepID=A0A291LEV0_9CAUD|nr:hypothetical protein [Aeromonas phage AS-szw]
MKTIKQSIIESLETAIENDFTNYRQTAGLCSNIYYDLKKKQNHIMPDKTKSFVGTIYAILQETFVTWPHYSGMLGYPIPSGCGIKPDVFYKMMRKDAGMYDGVYGDYRYDLAEWIISELKKDIG